MSMASIRHEVTLTLIIFVRNLQEGAMVSVWTDISWIEVDEVDKYMIVIPTGNFEWGYQTDINNSKW